MLIKNKAEIEDKKIINYFKKCDKKIKKICKKE